MKTLARSSAILSLFLLLGSLGSCQMDTTPTSPQSCITLTGQYAGVFMDSCGTSVSEDVTLFQTGCAVVAEFPGVGSVNGSVTSGTLVFAIGFAGFSPCGGSASGSASLTTSGGLVGSYNGQATGTGATCCGTVSGSFTLTRK
jgi:hypothetical protein